ncbi:MAG: hypothetical protein NTU95_09780 [Methanothrix sp.]|nr:hypothetical protein [Methanothrix sp.]
MLDQYARVIECKLKKIIPQIAIQELKYIFLLFLSTRIILTFIGVQSRIFLEPYHGKEYVWIYSDKLWLDIWGVWDTGWYLGIAANGYSATTAAFLNNQANYAFFPLYPLLMRLFSFDINNIYITGIIISNICLLISCIFLYDLVKLDESSDTAIRSVKYMFLFPTAFILSGVFTESLFLALALACFYYARKGNWLLVGLLGFFLSLTRSLGVLIIVPALYEYLKSKPISRDVFYLLMIPFGLLLFMIYNYYLTGDFLAFMHTQSAWGRSLANPLRTLYEGLIGSGNANIFPGLFTIISLSMMILFYKKIRFSYWIFGMYSIIVPLLSGLYSMPRFALVIFPLFILLAQMTKESNTDQVLVIFLALLQGCLMVFWSNGFPVII